MSETVMIVAGETSGELYGALLAASLKIKVSHLRVVGIGGERMRAAGVELLSGISSAFGLTEAMSSLKSEKEINLLSDFLASTGPAPVEQQLTATRPTFSNHRSPPTVRAVDLVSASTTDSLSRRVIDHFFQAAE